MSRGLHLNRFKVLGVAIGLVIASTAQAAGSQQVRAQDLGATPSDQLAQRLGLGAGMALVPRGSAPTVRGTLTVRMQQTYRDVPVYGHSVAVEQDAQGNALKASGALLQDVQPDLASVTPKLSGDRALAILINRTPAALVAAQRVRNKRAELYVYAPSGGGRARLAYLTSYVIDGPQPSRPTALIDADSGELIRRWEGLTHAEANGPGGNEKIGQYQYGTDFPALNVEQSGSTCTMRNANVETHDFNQGYSGPVYTFTCPTSEGDGINGAYSPNNDGHHFGGVVFDMYQAYVGSPPLTFRLTMNIHYGQGYENAFWDGSSMTFGDGANTFYPLVSLDVTAHEVSHGFTEQNSGLEYYSQSGGMNEAFSDMAGEAAEYFDRDGQNDFLVGADIFKGPAGQALRYMCDPPQDGSSIGHADDYYEGMDVHYSSGVYNKAFCLLAQTGGWTAETAFKAFARANDLHWNANETFDTGACGVETAAEELGYTVADVTAAFDQVGVSCEGGPPPGGGELQNGVPVRNVAGAPGSEQRWTLEVPAGASKLRFRIFRGSGDADLYVKFGSAPTTTSFDCRPYTDGNEEICRFPTPQAGTYHVMVRGYSAYSGVTLVGRYSEGN